jgi:hypothetical protein
LLARNRCPEHLQAAERLGEKRRPGLDLRHDRGEQHGAAHRRERVRRLGDHRRRRIAFELLQAGEQRSKRLAPFRQLPGQSGLFLAKLREPLLSCSDQSLGPLYSRRNRNHLLGQLLRLVIERRDLALEPLPPPRRLVKLTADIGKFRRRLRRAPLGTLSQARCDNAGSRCKQQDGNNASAACQRSSRLNRGGKDD